MKHPYRSYPKCCNAQITRRGPEQVAMRGNPPRLIRSFLIHHRLGDQHWCHWVEDTKRVDLSNIEGASR